MIFQVDLKMGKSQRIKGSSFEREIVNKHKDWGVDAKRVPLSGATDYAKHDVQIAGLFGECKIVKELKDMDVDKNQPDEFADMEKFKDYLKTTCNQ